MLSEETKNINITVSGWPASGCSTLAIILSIILERKFIYIGNLYRYLGSKLGFSDKGINRPQFDSYIEDIIGKTIDQYTDYMILNSSNILLDSDITAFRVGRNPKVFSIFLNTPFNIRKERLINNKLEMDLLEERDLVLQKKYLQLWDIDFFNIDLIKLKHTFVLDNSNMSLILEIKNVLEALKNWGPFTNIESESWEQLSSKSEKTISDYQNKGKEFLISKLIHTNNFMQPQEILFNITSLFPEDVSHFPEHIKKLFLSINKK